MSQNIGDFVTASADPIAFGEPTHIEPAFGWIRNELFAQLVERGCRSIAMETDRVAALVVNDFVHKGLGTLDTAMSEGFSHGFGELEPNRALVAWMREYNEQRPAAERLAFHGFDAATEATSAPSPRRYLEHARDYLGLDVDFTGLVGDDAQWSRTEAVWDAAQSPGASANAERLRLIADELLTTLYARTPQLVAATSRDAWYRAEIHLTAGIDLLRYHRQSARPGEPMERMAGLLGIRDAFIAQNIADIRSTESARGATMLFANNRHLQRSESNWQLAELTADWFGAGAIVAALDDRYTFIASSIGRSEALGVGEPPVGTYEAALQHQFPTWGISTITEPANTRTDNVPNGYFPLDEATISGADAILHINNSATIGPTLAR